MKSTSVVADRPMESQKARLEPVVENADPAVPENSAPPYSTGEGPVVIVDDDVNDAIQTEGVLADLRPRCPVQILTSGEDLVAYLQGEDLYSDRSRYGYPAMVLLDLKMPKMDGFEVLQWLIDHPEHGEIPVVVLSGWHEMSREVTRAYQLGARSFLPKPVQSHDIEGVLSILNISL